MKTVKLGTLQTTQLIYGCMKLGKAEEQDALRAVHTAYDCGIRMFDNADIYCAGESERRFGRALREIGRENVAVQSKCGIRPGYYDFSREHLLQSVEGSLRRIGTDCLDVLCLHRPDTLMEGEEVAEVFDTLHKRGMVRAFGVSNFTPLQIEYLKKYTSFPIVANQLQFGPAHTGMVDCGICANMESAGALGKDGGVLDYCRLHDIVIQAWGPLRAGHGRPGTFLDDPAYEQANTCLEHFAAQFDVTKAAVAVAWIERHSAGMQVILGSVRAERIREMAEADRVELSRAQWYEIYRAFGNLVP